MFKFCLKFYTTSPAESNKFSEKVPWYLGNPREEHAAKKTKSNFFPVRTMLRAAVLLGIVRSVAAVCDFEALVSLVRSECALWYGFAQLRAGNRKIVRWAW